jgi:hypothetical protein
MFETECKNYREETNTVNTIKKSRTQGWGREGILRIKGGENPGCQLLPAATRGCHENSNSFGEISSTQCHEIRCSKCSKLSISGALDLHGFQFGSDSRSFSS